MDKRERARSRVRVVGADNSRIHSSAHIVSKSISSRFDSEQRHAKNATLRLHRGFNGENPSINPRAGDAAGRGSSGGVRRGNHGTGRRFYAANFDRARQVGAAKAGRQKVGRDFVKTGGELMKQAARFASQAASQSMQDQDSPESESLGKSGAKAGEVAEEVLDAVESSRFYKNDALKASKSVKVADAAQEWRKPQQKQRPDAARGRKADYSHRRTSPYVKRSAASEEKAKAVVKQNAQLQRKQVAKTAAKKSVTKVGESTGKAVANAATKAATLPIKGMLVAAAPVLAVIALVVALIACVFIVIFQSPFGFFFSGENSANEYPIGDIVTDVTNEWYADFNGMVSDYESRGYVVEVSYNSDDDNYGASFDNWRDVIALHITQKPNADIEENTPLSLKSADVESIRGLYFAMNVYDVREYEQHIKVTEHPDGTVTEEIVTDIPQETAPPPSATTGAKPSEAPKEKVTYKTVKYADICVTNKRYFELSPSYNFNSHQDKQLMFLMGADSIWLWKIANINVALAAEQGAGFDPSVILNDLPYSSEMGRRIVETALSRIGDPYLLGGRQAPGGYIDCSGLTQWTLAQVGITLEWTAAGQAKQLVDAGRAIAPENAMPGDLIFWSYPGSGRVGDRYLSIGHVAVYCGNGMMVEAAPSAGGVVYRAVSVQGTPILWARPY